MPPVTDKGVVYYNEKADITITYPEGWLVLSDDEIDELLGGVRNGILNAYKDPAEAERALQQNIPVSWAFITQEKYPNMNMNLTKIDPYITVMVMDEATPYTDKCWYGDGSSEPIRNILTFGNWKNAKVGGVSATFRYIGQVQDIVGLIQKEYCVYRKGYKIYISLHATDPAEIDALQRAVNNTRFQ